MPHSGVGELTYGKRRGLEKAAKIIQGLRQRTSVHSRGVDDMSSREFPLNVVFVPRILRSAIVRKQRDFMIAGEVPQNVIRADLASGIDRQQFARFDPENAHVVYQQIPW